MNSGTTIRRHTWLPSVLAALSALLSAGLGWLAHPPKEADSTLLDESKTCLGGPAVRPVRVLELLLSLLAAASLFSHSTEAVERKYWELSPYTLRIELALSDQLTDSQMLGESLVDQLEERVFNTVHPLWSAEFVLSDRARSHELISQVSTPESQTPLEEAFVDKQLFLTIQDSVQGLDLTCREWDRSTQRWGPLLQRTVRQELLLAEHCFQLLLDSAAPLAQIQPDPNDLTSVQLSFKGHALPRRTDESLLSSQLVMQPLIIRFDQGGAVVPGGVREVPWTYVTTQQADDESWLGQVHSGMKRPFGLRRRGRTQQLAVAVLNPQRKTRVRFHARHDVEQGLAGYEVFQRNRAGEKSTLLGLTDSTGSIEVAPADVKVVTLFLRSDGQLLAKIPVTPGAKPLVEIPIADDTARLRAQAELTAFREQLIDVVARRNILVARVRNRIEAGEIDEARDFLTEFENLPGRDDFNKALQSAERKKSNTSQDPRVQSRIDKQFSETKKLLGRFLSVGLISDLRSEINAARSAK